MQTKYKKNRTRKNIMMTEILKHLQKKLLVLKQVKQIRIFKYIWRNVSDIFSKNYLNPIKFNENQSDII